MHTRQETFDASCLALIAQGHPGYDAATNRCRYGLGCAAALLMPPDTDFAALDRECPGAHVGPVAEALRRVGHDPYFVLRLQVVHDGTAYEARDDVSKWRILWIKHAHRLALDFELDFGRVREAALAAGWDLAHLAQ